MKKISAFMLLSMTLLISFNTYADYSGFYVFGDSLSSEQLWDADAPGQTGTGSNWPAYFRMDNPTPVYLNYAQGGAYTTVINASVASYLASNTVDRTGLYSVWGGANDRTAYAGNVINAVSQLHAAGAGTILVPNMHDAPYFNRVVTQSFNTNLNAGLNGISSDNIVQADVFSLLLEMQADPLSFGFTSAEDIFADSLHIKTAGTKIIADYFTSILSAGQEILLLPEGVLMETRSHLNTMLGKAFSLNTQEKNDKEFFAYLDMTSAELDSSESQEGIDGDGADVILGAAFKANDKLDLGAALGLVKGEYDFGSGNGSFSVAMTSFSLFLKASFNEKLNAALVMAIASPDVEDISREFDLGMKSITMNGSSSADLSAFTGALTYDFKQTANTTIGAKALFRHIDITVDEFSEDDNLSTSMKFSETERTSSVFGISFYFNKISENDLGILNFKGEVGYESDSGDTTEELFASVAKLNANPFKVASGYDAEGSAFTGALSLELNAVNGIIWKGSLNLRQGEDSTQTGIMIGASKKI